VSFGNKRSGRETVTAKGVCVVTGSGVSMGSPNRNEQSSFASSFVSVLERSTEPPQGSVAAPQWRRLLGWGMASSCRCDQALLLVPSPLRPGNSTTVADFAHVLPSMQQDAARRLGGPAKSVSYLLANACRMFDFSPEMWIGAEERI
jgi:hypothetical protein